MDFKKRIRAEDYEKMIHELESEVIQRQSMLHDMHIPKTSLEIASLYFKRFAEIKKLRLRLSESEKQVHESNEVKKPKVVEIEKLQKRPLGNALKGICSSSSRDLIADQSVLLCNFWEQMLRDQAWHPFKITLVEGKHQELIDEEDKLLKGLKNEWGERAYFAVFNALVEMNEYNQSGRNQGQALWNFKEKRRATVMEGVADLVHHLRKYHIPTATATATATTFNK
ncbi:hypothetical protein MKX01_031443 [Papaver californicum]|nr:hypothetical protein MKX01_031443 [Papaver californicum]